MTAKQYLKQTYMLDKLIKSNCEELNQLKELSTSISGIDYSKDKVSSGNVAGDAGFTNILCKIVDLEAKIQNQVDELIMLKEEIREKIDKIQSTNEKLLLRLKYINFYTWEQICDEMELSIRTIHRIHSAALINLQKFLM